MTRYQDSVRWPSIARDSEILRRRITRVQRTALRMGGSDWRKPTARRITVDAGCRRVAL